MPITLSELMKRIQDTSHEEQEELAQQYHDSDQMAFSNFVQQFMSTSETGLHSIMQLSNESFMPKIAEILRKESSLLDSFKFSFANSFKFNALEYVRALFEDESNRLSTLSGASFIPRSQEPERVIIYVPVFIPYYEPPSLN